MTADEQHTTRGLTSRVVGGTTDAVLRPVLGVMFLQGIAESAQAAYLGLWALRELGSSQSQLGLAFGATAVAALIAGYAAGQLSDRIGRRRPILVASFLLPVIAAFLGFAQGHVLVGLTLMVGLGTAAGMVFATQQALLTDLVPPERHENAFSSQRIVQNLGFMGGPLIGALLLTIGWRPFFLGTAAVSALAFIVALGAIPRDAPITPTEHDARSSLRVLIRDPQFAIFLAAGTLATIVYLSYETLLPISLVQSHGLSPSAWGILLAINPIVVVLCQMRLTARVSGVSEFTRLALGIAAMGTPFLLVSVSTALPLLILMLLVFVLGEMLWGPPSMSLIARLAPEDMRGAYFGASGAMWPAALALGPLIGLQVRGAFGDTAMWCTIAIIGALAIVLYRVASQIAGRSVRSSQRSAPPAS